MLKGVFKAYLLNAHIQDCVRIYRWNTQQTKTSLFKVQKTPNQTSIRKFLPSGIRNNDCSTRGEHDVKSINKQFINRKDQRSLNCKEQKTFSNYILSAGACLKLPFGMGVWIHLLIYWLSNCVKSCHFVSIRVKLCQKKSQPATVPSPKTKNQSKTQTTNFCAKNP